MSVRFRFGWVDAGPSSDILAQFTMATLSVEAGGATVTSVLDRGNRIYSNEVVVPLFSVAEWLVTNWWHIWYEIEDTGEQRPDFASRHNLAFAADGFVLPSLTMAAASGRMQLRWVPYKPQHARIEFVDEGSESVPRDELETELRNLIDAVIERLHGRPDTAPAAGNLARDWNAVNGLDADEIEFSRAAALLGIDPFDVPDQVAAAIVAFWERADPSVRDDALATATEDSLVRVADWLDGAIDALTATPHATDWPDIRQALPAMATAEPWERGYALARATRDRIGGNGGRIDFQRHGPLAISHRRTDPPSRRIDGLVAADSPACVTAQRGASGTRFLTARALGEYLGRSVAGPGLLTSLSTDSQAQSRAFAAEFLAPAKALRQRLAGNAVEPERADDLAQEFGVSSQLIRHQIENHNLATIVDY